MLLSSSFLAHQRLLAELLAYAVCQIFPDVLFLGGETCRLGFFYRFVFSQKLPSDALSIIETELKKNLKEDCAIRFATMMRENAQAYFLHHRQPFLAELAATKEHNLVEIVQIGKFASLCPELKELTSSLKISPLVKLFELQKEEIEVEGQFYQTTIIKGNSFANKQELKQFCKQYDRYKKKGNHLFLGSELQLFEKVPVLSQLETCWLPKGEQIRHTLKKWVAPYWERSEVKQVTTPNFTLFNKKNSKTTALFHAEGATYQPISSRLAAHSELIFLLQQNIGKQTLKVMEYGPLFHSVKNKDLEGILWRQVRYADQATLYCTKEEAIREIISFLHFIEQIIKIFRFKAHWSFITSLEKKGERQSENSAERIAVKLLREAVNKTESFIFQEEKREKCTELKEGPRLELTITDRLNRSWPCSTFTVVAQKLRVIDFLNSPSENREETEKRFFLKASIWGCLDRFIALLLEHDEGELPFWLAPEQVRILEIGEKAEQFAQFAYSFCQEKKLKVSRDCRSVALKEKLRDAHRSLIPVIVIIGEKEASKQMLTVQTRQQPNKSQFLTLDQFLMLKELEIDWPTLDKNLTY